MNLNRTNVNLESNWLDNYMYRNNVYFNAIRVIRNDKENLRAIHKYTKKEVLRINFEENGEENGDIGDEECEGEDKDERIQRSREGKVRIYNNVDSAFEYRTNVNLDSNWLENYMYRNNVYFDAVRVIGNDKENLRAIHKDTKKEVLRINVEENGEENGDTGDEEGVGEDKDESHFNAFNIEFNIEFLGK
ncbi:hypothetical protein HZH66_014702 [Vespula vulgaris]|uniref:Uncharacterized protein n=1 Tax=Vespula vulgaris TaxID=7454 RepID=A0A834J102_VESVU|nr:hypothetical protein HZH66_014702 [Vespula vulgaris]